MDEDFDDIMATGKRIADKLNVPIISLPLFKTDIKDSEIEVDLDDFTSITCSRNNKKYRYYMGRNGEEALQVNEGEDYKKIVEEEDYNLFLNVFFNSSNEYIIKNIEYFSEAFPRIYAMQKEESIKRC